MFSIEKCKMDFMQALNQNIDAKTFLRKKREQNFDSIAWIFFGIFGLQMCSKMKYNFADVIWSIKVGACNANN